MTAKRREAESSGLPRNMLKLARTLASAMDAGDPFTHGRPYRCSKFCVRLGRHFDLPDAEIEQLEYAALFQDLGKKAIHFGILRKPSRLTSEERRTIESHPQITAEIVREIDALEPASEFILCQYENTDGSGYPRGLAGEAVPLGSRILAVVSAFDAMTSDRPYRPALSPEAAMDELRELSGSQYDGKVVDALIELFESGELFEEFETGDLRFYINEQCWSPSLRPFLDAHGIRPAAEESSDEIDMPLEISIEGSETEEQDKAA